MQPGGLSRAGWSQAAAVLLEGKLPAACGKAAAGKKMEAGGRGAGALSARRPYRDQLCAPSRAARARSSSSPPGPWPTPMSSAIVITGPAPASPSSILSAEIYSIRIMKFSDAADSAPDAISSLVKQYYLARRAAPRLILLPQPMEDAAPFSQLLYEQLGKRVTLRVPQRGPSAPPVHRPGQRERRTGARHDEAGAPPAAAAAIAAAPRPGDLPRPDGVLRYFAY